MLMNFDTELDTEGVATKTIRETKTTVTQTSTATLRSNTGHSYQSKHSGDQWGWEELRDYVVDRIEFFHGPFPRDFRKEKSIFSRFLKEHGQEAVAIVKHVFEGPAATGTWLGAPISVGRFCRNSDPFFAIPILEKIRG